MNEEQRKAVEQSLWVVNAVLERLGLKGNEDMFQTASLYMCKCIERFDATKGTKWTTYAYKSIYFYIKRIQKDEEKATDYETLGDKVEYIKDYKVSNGIKDERLIKLFDMCTPLEKQIISLKVNGYSNKDIGTQLKCSRIKVGAILNAVKEKAKGVNNVSK